MSHLEYLELHIMNSCNLKCRGCSHFSNIASDDDVEKPESFEKNINRLAFILPVIYKIRLLGGEPLLNKELIKYCRIVRKAYPYTDIRIVTNGLLLDTISETILTEIAALKIGIDISIYPPTLKILPLIQKRLERCGISIELTPLITEFRKRMNLNEDADSIAAYSKCGSRHCHFYNNGYLSACPAPYVIKHYCSYFNLEIDILESDRLSIWKEDLTSNEIVSFLHTPMHICKLCDSIETFPWQAGVQAQKEDWLINQ